MEGPPNILMYDVWEEAYYEKWTSRVGCDTNIPLRLFENFLIPITMKIVGNYKIFLFSRSQFD